MNIAIYEFLIERIGIYMYDAGFSEQQAEKMALKDLKDMDFYEDFIK